MFNPADLAAKKAASPDLLDRIAGMSISELRTATAQAASRFFSSVDPQSASLTTLFWLFNLEFTKRGIAPAFRHLPRPPRRTYVPSRGTYEPLSEVQRNAQALCRQIDLEWLSSRGPALPKNRLLTRLLTDLRADDTAKFINLEQDRHRLVQRLSLHDDEQRLLNYFCSTKVVRDRLTAKRRAMAAGRRIAEAARGGRYKLPAEDIANREAWVHAIELAKLQTAKPSNADLALWMRYTTGRDCSRQAAGKMRQTLQSNSII